MIYHITREHTLYFIAHRITLHTLTMWETNDVFTVQEKIFASRKVNHIISPRIHKYYYKYIIVVVRLEFVCVRVPSIVRIDLKLNGENIEKWITMETLVNCAIDTRGKLYVGDER